MALTLSLSKGEGQTRFRIAPLKSPAGVVEGCQVR
jgi:hypothetical protein